MHGPHSACLLRALPQLTVPTFFISAQPRWVLWLPGRTHSGVIDFSWGLSVQKEEFWLGHQLRGRFLKAVQALVLVPHGLVLVPHGCCYLSWLLKLFTG